MDELQQHQLQRSKAVAKITNPRIAGPSIWNTAPETDMNLDFQHPGDKKDVELAELWDMQKVLPQVTVTRQMVDNAVAAIWDKYILSQEFVDFHIGEYDKVMAKFDDKINQCKKIGIQK